MKLHRRIAAFVAAIPAAAMTFAQVAPASSATKPAAESEPITLSVFEVTTDKDVGY